MINTLSEVGPLLQESLYLFGWRFKKIWFYPLLNTFLTALTSYTFLLIFKKVGGAFSHMDFLHLDSTQVIDFAKTHWVLAIASLLVFFLIKLTIDSFFDIFTYWRLLSNEAIPELRSRWVKVMGFRFLCIGAEGVWILFLFAVAALVPVLQEKWFLEFIILGVILITFFLLFTLPEIVVSNTALWTSLRQSVRWVRQRPVLTILVTGGGILPLLLSTLPSSHNLLFKLLTLFLLPLFPAVILVQHHFFKNGMIGLSKP